MKHYKTIATMENNVMDAESFRELMISTYKRNVEIRKRKEKVKTYHKSSR